MANKPENTAKVKQAFDDHPAFYENDNRRYRGFNPVSKAFLETKFSVLTPARSVKGKRILDLGSCNGAAGQWVLFNGATHYTGVELQSIYAEQAKTFLAHWDEQATIVNQDIRGFLKNSEPESYDIVIVAGVLYHFIDTKNIIDEISRVAKESIIIETNFPPGMRSGKLPVDAAITEYIIDQEVNLATQNASLLGISATTSLSALDILLGLNGFEKHEEKLSFPLRAEACIYDESILGTTDLHIRFAVRYYRNKKFKALTSLENNLPNETGEIRLWSEDDLTTARSKQYQKHSNAEHNKETPTNQDELKINPKQPDNNNKWKFDARVAEQFEFVAQREIPDYLRVIDLCVRVIEKSTIEQPKIIDVGSAIGQTLKHLYQVGYRNLYGVDYSAEMIAKSFNKATLIHSSQFPRHHAPFDYIIANWVLHFIQDRKSYLKAIAESLADNGTLILTDKVSSSACVHDLYHDLKRANGVSEEEIENKRRQIQGVLVTYPFSWYIETLEQLGFEHIEVINANTAFVTFMASKNKST